MIVRAFDCGEEQMPQVGRRSREILEGEFTEVNWEHSHVVVDDTGNVRTFCVYDAPNKDAVLAHSEKLGMHNLLSVDEIAGDVTPADFPPA
jgi:hypothetical protein